MERRELTILSALQPLVRKQEIPEREVIALSQSGLLSEDPETSAGKSEL